MTKNTIYFWDIKSEISVNHITEQNSKGINQVVEISHLRCLAVSYSLDDNYHWIYVYRNQEFKKTSKLRLNYLASQIHYNRHTQTLLLLGQKSLPIYAIDALSLDLSLIACLHGHESIITAITNIT
jgi:hypothetical protein